MGDDAVQAKQAFRDAWDRMVDRLYEDLVRQCAAKGLDPAHYSAADVGLTPDGDIQVRWAVDPDKVEIALLEAARKAPRPDA